MTSHRNIDHGPLSRVTKGISGIISLATEVHARSTAEKFPNPDVTPGADVVGLKGQAGPLTYNDPNDGGEDFAKDAVERPQTVQPLPYPVILFQRRPNSKSRGFVRAYAPDLWQYKGIDQQTFLTFLKDFHKSSQASPVFQVINVAAFVAGFAPSAIAMAVSAGVMAASRAAIEVQGRVRTNNYLEKANDELFHPRNLHCMIMTLKPEAQKDVFLNFNFSNGAISNVPKLLKELISPGGQSESRSKGKSDGTTEGELALPEMAPLIFPTPTNPERSLSWEGADEGADELSLPPQEKSSSWKSTRKVVSDYRDRRAQAEFAGKHGQDSKLVVPGAADPSKFASKFSDPNHPVNSGHPFALLTGGKLRGPEDVKAKLAGFTGMEQRISPKEEAIAGLRGGIGQARASSGGLLGGVKGFMRQDVLYLLIAEMPSEEAMTQLAGDV